MNNKEKIFILSLHRSASTSAHDLLKLLGIKARHWVSKFEGKDMQAPIVGKEHDLDFVMKSIKAPLDHFEAMSDVPVCVMYKQLLDAYPDAKFLLVLRNPFDWARSVKRHTRNRDLHPFERVQYYQYLGADVNNLADVSVESLVAMYSEHTFRVFRFFEQQNLADNLLIVEVADAECGPKICEFLGSSERLALPHMTNQAKFERRQAQMAKRKQSEGMQQ